MAAACKAETAVGDGEEGWGGALIFLFAPPSVFSGILTES